MSNTDQPTAPWLPISEAKLDGTCYAAARNGEDIAYNVYWSAHRQEWRTRPDGPAPGNATFGLKFRPTEFQNLELAPGHE